MKIILNKHRVAKHIVVESVSNKDLGWFFQQWLYQPGQPKYSGFWSFDSATNNLNIKLDQVQNNSTFFRMPIDLGIYYSESLLLEKLELNQTKNSFTFSLETPPDSIKLDPYTWILMETDFMKK